MNYLLTEDEANRLYSVRGQLRMLASLLCAGSTRTNGDTLCMPADLSDFMDAQSEVLGDLVQAIEARHDAQRSANAMSASDWMHLIRIVNGEEDRTPGNSATSIDSKLRAAAQVDDEMRRVHEAWLDALVLSGERGRNSEAASTAANSPARRSKRERLATGAQ